ncbi:FBOX protein [Geosmithia morbida]|uniref:FBOX protein n=1 Tax=Geosmithia morbida TaxID=1094350 RepID=A0A9P4YPX4_9HYPO|nr:FBOX protein [Geosmithia morbida]KAF4119563.1 FBOX protein [Geosmithia morbida]
MLVAATDSIVVIASPVPSLSAGAGRVRILRIYHMEHREWKRITLPAGLSKCYANSEMLIATCHGGQAIIWEWNGVATELAMEHEPPTHHPHSAYLLFGGIPGAVFHPSEPGLIFLVWVYGYELAFVPDEHGAKSWSPEDVSPACTFVISRYEKDQEGHWTPTARFEHSSKIPYVQERHVGTPKSVSDVEISLDCQKVDSNGSFSLCFIRSRSHYDWPAPHRSLHAVVIQCFNVFTMGFFDASYWKPPGEVEGIESAVSNNESGTWCDSRPQATRLWNMQIFEVHKTFSVSDASFDFIFEDDDDIPRQRVSCFKPGTDSDEGCQEGDARHFDCEDPKTTSGNISVFVHDHLMVFSTDSGYHIAMPTDPNGDDHLWLSPTRLSTRFKDDAPRQSPVSPPKKMDICHCFARPHLADLERFRPGIPE